jgi:hypothetical protein
MTLADLSDLSQALGAIAVFASLIFIGVQIRQNTKAQEASSHHAVTDSFNAINTLIRPGASRAPLAAQRT